MSLRDTVKLDFLARRETLQSVFADFPDWHLGRSPYLLWAIALDQAPVRALAAQATDHLAGYLAAAYVRQPHVTLGLCGFPASPATHPDDFAPSDLAGQLHALATAAIAPFDIVIEHLGSFALAPFLHVAGAPLAPLHAALGRPWPEQPAATYVPHLTVGLYADRWDSHSVQQRLDAFAAPPLVCRVERLALLGYEPTQVGGPLRTFAEFDLASGRLDWLAERPWPAEVLTAAD